MTIRAGQSKHMPPTRCLNPECRKRLDMATAVMSGGIHPGDMSVCFYCGHLSVLGDDYRLREPTDAEIYDAAGDKRILRVQEARLAATRAKPK